MRADTKDDREGATQIGEINLHWKHCCSDKNKWINAQSFLVRGKETQIQNVTGQVNVMVAFFEKGHEKSSFELDGSKKVKKEKVGSGLISDETQASNDLAACSIQNLGCKK